MGLFEDFVGFPDAADDGSINGIVTGTVKENYHKDHPGQVRVELFLGENGKNVTGWIPVMSPYAGAEFGAYALPEVGSEVVVAFRMGDRNRPIVLGSLWSDKNKLPKETAVEKNTKKTILTKGGNELTIDDTQDKNQITVRTKNGKCLELNEEKDCMVLHDKDNKNSITIDSQKGVVTVTADKKIILKVGGNEAAVFDGSGRKISLKSASVALNADKDVSVKGQDVKVNGTSVKVEGTSALQLTSSGSTQVKGTIVKIN